MARVVTVLFSVLPGYGHIYPLRPLADALIRAGCEVRLAGSRLSTAILRRMGYATLDIGPEWTLADDLRRARERYPTATPREHWSRIFSTRSAEMLTAMIRADPALRPNVIVHDDHDFAGALYGERVGSYRVCVATTFRSPIETQRARWHQLWSSLRTGAGLAQDPAMDGFWGHVCIDTIPPSFQPNPLSSRRPQDLFMNPMLSDIALRDMRTAVPVPGTSRKIGITFGTVYSGFSPSLHKAAAALTGEGFSVTRLNGTNGSPQPRAAYLDWLRDQDIVVCHGGRSTMLDCLALGIPVVCQPMGADQSYNSFRVASLGAGIDLGQAPDVDSAVVDAVHRICADNLYHRNAWRLSQEMGTMPSADECATSILDTLARHRTMEEWSPS
ncbi:glycosyltransferase [Dactylosporangium siamense]|uniref:Erythromycin biosynthesis protein CIII-like C-terminal domain-containing protein n=1 Tax=Dactylosporangium siamense TaxID=685454 RepID=A0A919U662_9ACTN|nr:nucleotide disphospho-sugar-binding domain-containing protein [Dactylosporangium siamense]GIG44094.1 hypothetical protein Dsi01nite_021350 [Dactylosporangium siamense]